MTDDEQASECYAHYLRESGKPPTVQELWAWINESKQEVSQSN